MKKGKWSKLSPREKISDTPRPYAEIGDRIKQFRTKLGIPQADFYDGIVATQPQASRYESGMRAPTVEVLALLRKHGADLNYIVTGS